MQQCLAMSLSEKVWQFVTGEGGKDHVVVVVVVVVVVLVVVVVVVV